MMWSDKAIQAAADELGKWETQDFSEPAVRWSAAIDALFAAVKVNSPTYREPTDEERKAVARTIAIDFLTDTGPCAFCGDTEIGARHRIADSIVDEVFGMLIEIEKDKQ